MFTSYILKILCKSIEFMGIEKINENLIYLGSIHYFGQSKGCNVSHHTIGDYRTKSKIGEEKNPKMLIFVTMFSISLNFLK